MNNEYSDNIYGMRIEYVEYTIKKGDSLYAIAKEYGTSVSDLIDINMLTSNTLYPGQVILVPKQNKKYVGEYAFDTYVIEPNDSIIKIAEKENVDPVLIGTYNDFGELKLEPGQTITLPRNSSYTILKNDTVDSILNKTRMSAEQLLRNNAETWLKIGNKINL